MISGTMTRSQRPHAERDRRRSDQHGVISVPTGTLVLDALSNYGSATKTLSGGTYLITAPGVLRSPGAR